MKQKVIVKVSITDEKSRKKAMKIVVGHSGVESASLQAKDKNQIEVVGEGIDSVVITRLLRKCLGYAELLSVSTIPVPEKKVEGGDKHKSGTKNDNEVVSILPPMYYPQYYPYNGWGGRYGYDEVRRNDDHICNIM